MPADDTAALLLTNRLTSVDVAPLKAREYWKVVGRVSPGELMALDHGELSQTIDDAPLAGRIVALLDAATAFSLERERLESTGIRMLSSFDDAYPAAFHERLGESAPPMLYGAGPVEWLDGPLVGVVGSRDVDEDGAAAARAMAARAAEQGRGVVSGGAKGVDLLAMDAAFESRSPVVGVTAEGLGRAGRRRELRAAVGEERLCLVSPYGPDAGFSVGSAMGRNKLIYALADVTFVVASDHDSGGTWAGATEALRRGFGRVAVWTGAGAGPGNSALVERGGVPVDTIDDLDLDQLIADVADPATARPAPASEQLGLGLEA